MDDLLQQRTRAWRRKKKFHFRGRDCRHTSLLWKPQKKWKYLCTRQDKLARSKKLGIEYPRVSKIKNLIEARFNYWTL
ncbi:hypothetical protein F991_01009 [Acinetobacter sp. CIP-A165]|uniref:hypothetical protein n=1 Tax=Acinetobacter sp. CIP-A165 TaxID=40373 RepID=UPI0002CFF70A|nr:hypothetical protein [Acinetobacter sp. CIP-A165]ENU31103.1 hypothetical protein F991_01009 [Acinetobacter sp. CIP-A165]